MTGEAALWTHVAGCDGCAAFRRGLVAIPDLAIPVSPPPDLTTTVLGDPHLRRHSRIGPRGWASPAVALTALAALTVIGLLLPLAAAPASAHAVLVGSDPEPDAVLAAPPATVDLLFDEGVTLLADSIRVFGPNGSRVDEGDVAHRHGDTATVSVTLRPDLSAGTYLVSYRVVSDDSHPIGGAYTFAVGHVTRTPAEISAGDRGSTSVDVGLGVSRWLGYVGSALGLGGFAFLVWCWPAGWGSRRARALVTSGVGALIVGTLLGLLLKGPYDEASGLGAVPDGPLLRQVLATTYGEALDARLLLLAVLVLVLTYRDHLPARVLAVAPAALLVGVGVTFALCGHAAAGGHRLLAVASDAVHLTAMSVWLGGLVLLLGAALVGEERDEIESSVLRFSNLATGAVTALVATGSYQAVREVRSWDALLHTHYGHVLVVKLGLVALAFLAATGSRTWVWQTVHPVVAVHAATSAPPSPVADGRPGLRRLRLSVGLETMVLVSVLAATALLVTSDPARSSSFPKPVTRNISVGPDRVRVSAVPDGVRRIHVTVDVSDTSGRPAEPQEVDASLVLPSAQIGPLPIHLTASGRGRRSGQVSVPVPGDWQLAVTVRTSAVDEDTEYVDVPVE
jgi:copper transport protein